MIFSSLLFIMLFLPLSLAAYYLTPKNINLQNLVLVILSIVFYAFGDMRFVISILMLTTFNYVMGIFLQKTREAYPIFIKCRSIIEKYSLRNSLCILVVLINLLVLAYYKYIPFCVNLFNHQGQMSPYLPLGISFFTFQNISYIVDVYRKKTPPELNYINYLLYIMFFPQLIAGPIVKYTDVSLMLRKRTADINNIYSGLCKFSRGLFKKVALATTLSLIADEMFEANLSSLPANYAWLGAIAYTFQIYYDFSGYSDMAIGLGRMFGIYYPDNFSHPYMATSITEFFRRWHITLSNFFKDYVYIPLGGNRRGNRQTVINTMIVFILTGIWHGAGFTYLLWGIINGIIISCEKIQAANQYRFKNLIHGPDRKVPPIKLLKHILTLTIITTGWVIFRSQTLHQAFLYLSAMYTHPVNIHYGTYLYRFINIKYIVVLSISVLTAGPYLLLKAFFHHMKSSAIMTIILYTISVLLLISGTYTPFIYFKF